MPTKSAVWTLLTLLTLLLPALASAGERTWQAHDTPYTFLFGNHIDTHQELKIVEDNPGELHGYLYVFDSGEITASGLPIFRHCTMAEHYAAGCVAGWKLRALPCIPELNACQAMYLYHYHDHPPWLVCPSLDSSGNLRGERQCAVQPGSYTHFHWLTEGASAGGNDFPSDLNPAYPLVQPGDLPEGVIDSPLEEALGVSVDVPEACNVAMASQLAPGAVCPGYFLELKAVEPLGHEVWVFHHGGQDLVVGSGIDDKTHLNLLFSYAPEEIPQEVLDDLPPFSGGHGEGDGSGGGSHTGGGGHGG